MQKNKISLFSLTKIFFHIGYSSFGGWTTAHILMKKVLVEDLHALTAKEMDQAVAYSQLLPGSTVVGIVSNIGYRLHGWPGSIVSTVAYLLPSATCMTVLAVLYFGDIISPAIKDQMKGAYAALVGILLANSLRLGQEYNKSTVMWLMSLVILGARIWLGINTAFLVLVAGLIGAVFFAGVSRGK